MISGKSAGSSRGGGRTVFSYKKSLYSPIPIKCAISLTEKASEKLDGVIELLGDIV